MKKTILAVIPARGGSKSVPKKNIKNLAGKPLLQYIFEAAKKSKYIDKLVLSTDSDEIAEVGESFGLEAPFLRPNEFATDAASSISVIKHALKFFDDKGIDFNAVISLQVTNPFTKTSTIDAVIELWLKSRCDTVTTVAEVTQAHPYIMKRLKPGNIIEPFCIIPEGSEIHRRQLREAVYYMTGAIYMRARRVIEADMDGHFLGKDARAVVVDGKEAIDINSAFDFEFAEWVASRKKHEDIIL